MIILLFALLLNHFYLFYFCLLHLFELLLYFFLNFFLYVSAHHILNESAIFLKNYVDYRRPVFSFDSLHWKQIFKNLHLADIDTSRLVGEEDLVDW